MRYLQWLAAAGYPVDVESIDGEWWDVDSDEEPFVRLVQCLTIIATREGERRFRLLPPQHLQIAEESDGVAAGDYVALQMLGSACVGHGDWVLRKGEGGIFTEFPRLDDLLTDANVRFAICRDSPDGGIVTLFLPRAGTRRGTQQS